MNLATITRKINSTPWYNNQTFIKDQISKNRLNPLFRNIPDLVDALQMVYPNKWDMHLEFCPEAHLDRKLLITKIHIIIKFDEITITNSRGKSHDIKDLFVRLTCKYDSNNPEGMYIKFKGCRSTVTIQEFVSGYQHSHLPSGYMTEGQNLNFLNFCQGSGEISELLLVTRSNFNIMNFKLILFQIETVVSWESLGGGPHIKMERVGNERSHAVRTISQQDQRSFYNRFIHHNNKPQIDFGYDKKYFIVDNDLFEDCLTSVAEEAELSYFLCLKDSLGNYFTEQVSLQVQNINRNKMLFQGQDVEFEVTGTSENTERKIVINPSIRNYVKQQLERKINKQIIRESITQRQGEIRNTN